jgi:SRSO17 transposase
MTGELQTYLCNALAHTPLATLGRLSERRWPIETCFEDGTQYLGMGDYEVRSWRGWHHQMTLVILAHVFLVRLRLRLKKAPGLTLPQVQVLLLGLLRKRDFDAQMTLDLVGYWQRRNQAA